MVHYITTLLFALAVSAACTHARHHHRKLKATCEVSADSGVESQNVTGTIRLIQRKSGGRVKIKIKLSGFDASDGESVHGFHIHQNGDLGNQCSDAGGHYNPGNVTHAARNNTNRHVGDLGNIEEDDQGRVNTTIKDNVISLRSEDNERYVVGRAIVIHATEDDLGLGGNEGSLATGNAGGRLACCVIAMETTPDSHSTASAPTDPESTYL